MKQTQEESLGTSWRFYLDWRKQNRRMKKGDSPAEMKTEEPIEESLFEPPAQVEHCEKKLQFERPSEISSILQMSVLCDCVFNVRASQGNYR